MPGRTKQRDGDALTDLESAIPRIFDQAQISTANHQKNFVALHKLHTEASQYTERANNGRTIKLTGERKFEDTFTLMLTRILPIKKGVGPADRMVKFVGGYVRFVNEKATEKGNGDVSDQEDPDEDTTASRFTARLLKFLLKGFLAKDKFVRYRVLCTVAEMVSHLGVIDEEIFEELRNALLERMHDKEHIVRVQVVISLSKLASSEDPTELTMSESVLEVLLDVLTHDSSPEVRRAALLNIPLNPFTVPHILARTRDTDTTMRKLVYSAILNYNVTLDEEDHKDTAKVRTKTENELVASSVNDDVKPDLDGLENTISGTSFTGNQTKQIKRSYIGPTHPRALTITQRELIVQNGLGDRESSVRATAEALMGTWVDVVNVGLKFEGETVEEANDGVHDQGLAGKPTGNEAVDQCVAFLKLFDLENDVASDALLSVFASRPEIYDGLEFDNQYWSFLTSERAFLARVFVDHCCASKNMARLEATLPVVTALAFRVQEAYNNLVDRVRKLEEKRCFSRPEDLVKEEDERTDKEFIISEMLTLAVNLDYSDEIGRRKMFQLMRDMLSQDTLPERLLTKCLDVLRGLSASERDLIRIVVEIIQDLRDRGEDDEEDSGKDSEVDIDHGETPASARPPRARLFNNKEAGQLTAEQQAQKDEIDLRCLSLCIGVLERVNSKLEDNSTLDGILKNLIFPAVQQKEVSFHKRGLICLGLCSLIDRNLALGSFGMYCRRATSDVPEELKITALQVMFDMLMVHEHDFSQLGDSPQQITDLLITRLTEETSPKVKALLAIGISKLVLCGMISDIKAIKKLIMTYLSPDTVDNQELRQCLTFFFPVFCYSSAANQMRIREIFMDTFSELSTLRRRLDDDEVISAAQVVTLFVDWTDPLKLTQAIIKGKTPAANETIQVDLASDVLTALLDKKNNFEKEDKRVLTHMLSKLHISDTVDDDKIRTLKLLIHSVQTRRPLRDAISNNGLRKFDTAISKKFEAQLEGFSEEEYRKLSELQGLFEFLDDIIPEDDDEDDTDIPRRKGRKRCSGSIATTSTESLRHDSPIFSRDGLPQAKRRRTLSPMNDCGELDGKEGTPPPENPTRTMPKRNTTVKKTVINLISDESDEEVQPTRKRPPPNPRQHQRKVEDMEEALLDEDISRLLSSRKISAATTATSSSAPITGDSEEDEDEVNESLLVDED